MTLQKLLKIIKQHTWWSEEAPGAYQFIMYPLHCYIEQAKYFHPKYASIGIWMMKNDFFYEETSRGEKYEVYKYIFKKLSKDRNEELEEFMLGEYYFRKLLNEIAKRIKVNFETLTYFSPDEIVGCLHGKSIPASSIEKRKKLFGFLIKNGKVSEYYGKEAEFLIEHQSRKTDQVKGIVACRSQKKIRGIVKIIHTSTDIKKVKKGNILVAIMTTPNYIQAIYNTVAIITDEGGITCHAAIVSRELNIPCIIGTKIATKVLRDGDFVEVDANKGIVRIIK